MRYRFHILAAFPFVVAAFSCSSDLGDTEEKNPEGNTGTGGTSENPNTGGAMGTGGGDQLGTGGSLPGAGGSLSGTGGEVSGAGGNNEPVDATDPSPGCGVGGRPENGIAYQDSASPHGPSWLIFPEKYDGDTPLPVLFGFHGCGGGGDQNGTPYLSITRNNGFETDYIVAAPVSSVSNCYDYAVDMPKAKALYTELINNYCVDMNRVFATGHSFGAGGMVMALTDSANADDFAHFNFKAIVPVAGWPVWDPQVVVPTMYIQGVTDAERDGGDGKPAADKIAEVNSCSSGPSATEPTQPYVAQPYPVDACNSLHDGDPVNAGCRSYEGCEVPTVWCRHDDSDYGGTFHGIPCFYQQAMYDFFESL